MHWYEGNIAEAVQKSRVEGAVFGVAIFGDDEGSVQLEEALKGLEVQEVLMARKFVCIRISGNTEPHFQFSQIYPGAPCPSIYLIGDKGALLEVIKEPVSAGEMKKRFTEAWDKHLQGLNKTPAGGDAQPQPKGSGSGGDISKPSASNVPKKTLEEANEAVKEAENAANEAGLTLEHKIERAKVLAAAKREQKLAEEAEDVKRKERERREMGKGMAELKRWQEEQDMKRMIDERKKDKKEETELRKRLKEQIAADRAARNARSNLSYVQDGPHPPVEESSSSSRPTGLGTSTSTSKDYSGQARLQFRLPAGTSITHAFEPVVTLSDVRTFLINNNQIPFRPFSISVAYPRRQFTSSEYSSTLRDLGLVPSAALLILPMSGNSTVPLLGGSGIGRLLSLIFSYLMIPFSFLYSLIQRALPSSTPPSDAQAGPSSASTSSSTSRREPTAASKAAELRIQNAEMRKRKDNKTSAEGNIHRLRNDDSDDDRATYNGNSTQQM